MAYEKGEPTDDDNPLPVNVEDLGMASITNSTARPLAGGATWTGDWEDITAFLTLTVIGKADEAGTLWADFSTDGTDAVESVRNVQLSSGVSGDFGIHGLIRVAKYFRLRLVNGATPQTAVSVQAFCNQGSVIAIPTSRAQQVINDFTSVVNTRQLSETRLDEAAGRQANRTVVQKFGRNPSVVSATTEHINIQGGATYAGFLTSAVAVRIRAGGDALDTAAGNGARSVIVMGVDDNFVEVSEVIATNGALVSLATTQTFRRVNRVYVVDSGLYGASNEDDILIESTGGALMAQIIATHGQTEQSNYTIPAGKTGYIRGVQASVEGGKPANVDFWHRPDAHVTSAPFTSPRVWFVIAQLSTEIVRDFKSYPGPFSEKTDLFVTATAQTGNSPAVSASYDLVLVDN